ncbi:glutamyl aminopeptidase-like isoform X3 [Arapaima gigas]
MEAKEKVIRQHFLLLRAAMVESMDFEETERWQCARGKCATIVCGAVVMVAVSLGLGLGLAWSSLTAEEETPGTVDPPALDGGPRKASSDTSGAWRNFRLPDYITPTHYDLHMEPDLEKNLYTGNVSIRIELSEPTHHLWLHMKETFINSPPRLQRVARKTLQEVPLKGCFRYEPCEYVVMEAVEKLPPTSAHEYYVLTLGFQGWLNNSLVGFYSTTYQENGATK